MVNFATFLWKDIRRMLMPTRGNPIRRMSGILLRLFQSIKHRQRLVFLRNRLRESLHTNRASLSLALLGRAATRRYMATNISVEYLLEKIQRCSSGESYGPHRNFLTNLERDKIKMIFQNIVGATLCRPQKSSPK